MNWSIDLYCRSSCIACLCKLFCRRSVNVNLAALQVNSSEESDCDDEDDSNSTDEDTDGATCHRELHSSINPIVNKIRNIVRWFRKSPVRNEVLQKYVREERGQELMLVLDCKTRWNSLCDMLDRFDTLKAAVHKAIIDIGDKRIKMIDDYEYATIPRLIRCLRILKLGAEALCRRESGLLEAGAALTFILDALVKEDSAIARKLSDALKQRIIQRQSRAAKVLQTLHNKMSADRDWKYIFPSASRKEVQDLVVNMVGRMGGQMHASEVVVDAEAMDVDDPQPAQSLQSMLQQALDKIRVPEPDHSSSASRLSLSNPSLMTKAIRKELENLPASGRTGMIALSYSWLKDIVPTSVESERVFSTVGNIVTKVRSSLGDEAVDALCFLKCYYRGR